MRKSGLSVPAAALLSGFVVAAAAQEPARDSVFLPIQAALSTNSLDPVPTTHPPGSVAGAKNTPLAGNPLSAIALGELSETQARPLFSPSRRPPALPVLAAVSASPIKPSPPAKSGPDHPLLTLLGTIVGGSVEIGVFADEVSHDVVRLKAGEARDGWMLSAVTGRAAVFQKQGYPAATLSLPAPGAEANTPSVVNTFAPPVIPAATKGGSKRPPREG